MTRDGHDHEDHGPECEAERASDVAAVKALAIDTASPVAYVLGLLLLDATTVVVAAIAAFDLPAAPWLPAAALAYLAVGLGLWLKHAGRSGAKVVAQHRSDRGLEQSEQMSRLQERAAANANTKLPRAGKRWRTWLFWVAPTSALAAFGLASAFESARWLICTVVLVVAVGRLMAVLTLGPRNDKRLRNSSRFLAGGKPNTGTHEV